MQLNARIPGRLRQAVKSVAMRKGVTLDEYVTRVLSAAVESEDGPEKPGFLEAWEKLLAQFREKK